MNGNNHERELAVGTIGSARTTANLSLRHCATNSGCACPVGSRFQTATKQNIPDVKLVDQDEKTVHLYSDLLRGHVAALSFIFTTCTTICPLIGANLGRLQAELGQSLGEDIVLVSVSVDPATDTPQRMKAWGAQFGAKPGWSLLTGDKGIVDQLLKVLGCSLPISRTTRRFSFYLTTGPANGCGSMPLKPLLPGSPRSFEKWQRPLEPAFQILRLSRTSVTAAPADSNPVSPAERYFGNVVLTKSGWEATEALCRHSKRKRGYH